MNMNFGRTLMTGTTHQSSQPTNAGNLFSGSPHTFSRSFGTRQNSMDYDTHHNRLIMGLKNIVNGLISPVNNFDLCSRDLHRKNFASNTMAGVTSELMATTRPQEEGRLKTAILELGVGTNLSQTQQQAGFSEQREAEVIAVHSSEEFPELPAPKNSCWQPKPKQNGICSSFKKILSKPGKAVRCAKQDSECDSEESFVIFSDSGSPNCSPSEQSDLSGMCNRSRQRQISECSDDSFVICFTEDAPEGVLEVLSDDDDDGDDGGDDCGDVDTESESDLDVDSDDNDDDAEHQEDKDEIDSMPHFTQKTENCFLHCGETSQPDSGFDEQKPPTKRVRFNLKPEVHVMHVWNYAYRASRRGHWDIYARDRDRFERRIASLADILNPVLDSKHRERIYETRFCDKTSVDQLEPLERKDTRT